MSAGERGTRGKSGGRALRPLNLPPPELHLDLPAKLRRTSRLARLRANLEEIARAARERADADRIRRENEEGWAKALTAKAIYVTRPEALRQSAKRGRNRHFGEIASFEEKPNWEARATAYIQAPNARPNDRSYTVTPYQVFAAAQLQAEYLRGRGLDASAGWGRVQEKGRRWSAGVSSGTSDARGADPGWYEYTYTAIVMGIEVKW